MSVSFYYAAPEPNLNNSNGEERLNSINDGIKIKLELFAFHLWMILESDWKSEKNTVLSFD